MFHTDVAISFRIPLCTAKQGACPVFTPSKFNIQLNPKNREGRPNPGLRPLVSLRIVGRVGPSALGKPKDPRKGRPKPGLRPLISLRIVRRVVLNRPHYIPVEYIELIDDDDEERSTTCCCVNNLCQVTGNRHHCQ